jgi:hypothetical protein
VIHATHRVFRAAPPKQLRKAGQFYARRFGRNGLVRHDPFDIGILIGVLHYLDDREASELLALLRSTIRSGGRPLDNVFIENQNLIARKLIEWDRGKNVRTSSRYVTLLTPNFGTIRETLDHKKFPPYTLFVMECSWLPVSVSLKGRRRCANRRGSADEQRAWLSTASFTDDPIGPLARARSS